jgi:hypothetical protein
MNGIKTIFVKRCFVCYGKGNIGNFRNNKRITCPECDGVGCLGKRMQGIVAITAGK